MATVKSYFLRCFLFLFYKRRPFEKSRNVTHRNVSEKERLFSPKTRKESLSDKKEKRRGEGGKGGWREKGEFRSVSDRSALPHVFHFVYIPMGNFSLSLYIYVIKKDISIDGC